MAESHRSPELDRALRDLAAHIDYPPTPNLTSMVRHRIQQLPNRRRRQPGDPDVAQPMRDDQVPESEDASAPRPWLRLLYQEGRRQRYFPRELAKTAAAILVLVLVGGVLAVVFHGMGGGNHSGVGGGATATAGSQLPMTVTANGVAIELQSVDSTSTVTRLSFMIRLAPGQLSRDRSVPFVLGSDLGSDVMIDGITPGPNDPSVAGSQGTSSHSSVIGFTLDYHAPFPSNKTVTLTIKQLTLPVSTATPAATPATSQQIDGPWTFKITPASVANQPMPTPFSSIGRFGGVSVAQAQKWTNFPIVVPKSLAPPLNQLEVVERNTFNVNGFAVGASSSAKANYVVITYEPPIGNEVVLVETTDNGAVPSASGGTASVPMPLSPASTPQTTNLGPGMVSTPTFDGIHVTWLKITDATTNATTVYYVWNLGGVNYSLSHVVDTLPPGKPHVTDTELQELVASIIAQHGSTTTATATASAPPPTPGPLPQTVSASGLRITLASATRSGKQVVLTFKIESADPNQPNMWEVGGGGELMGIMPPENDIVSNGLWWDQQNQAAQGIRPLAPTGFKPAPPAPSPTPQPTPDITGYLESLGFVLTNPADQPVTVTIRRVRFNNAPSTRPPGKIISGIWSFAFVPASLPAPTPTSTSISAP